MSLDMNLDTDVVIVGAGPIGLAHAWAIKKINPNLKVVVLEKYEEFQRKHTLVMEYQQLEKLMKASDSTQDPDLMALLAQLKKDPNIRTNALQEKFKQKALALGVEIRLEEVKKETSKEQLLKNFPNARLIIGADGTHSVVSETLFSEGNQVKHEFDYVLQLRFEIDGEDKSSYVESTKFYQLMARSGLIANEYVGNFENGKTPVTMQMMISKKDFEALKQATSKNPVKPFATLGDEHPVTSLPPELEAFINKYLEFKIKSCYKAGEVIDRESIRISVNEAPATHARQVMTETPHAATSHTVLVGDAALGLSYFKGLNAGLESAAVFIENMKPALQNSLNDKEKTKKALTTYQNWFLNVFSPRKIKEVAQYSTWRIRSTMRAVEVVSAVKMASVYEHPENRPEVIRDYFNLLAQNPLAANEGNWQAFPHREHDLVKLGQFSYVPIKYTLKRTAKLFVDYFKPYKSDFQLGQDFKQPLVGLNNFFVGLGKLVIGACTLNPKRLGDGFFTLLRGVIEIATTPLAWVVKPITRGLITLIRGYKKIEDNSGVKKLADYGLDYVASLNDKEISPEDTYAVLAVCNDIHRKVDKSTLRGQKSSLILEEMSRFSALRADSTLDRAKVRDYFTLFADKNTKTPLQQSESEHANTYQMV